MEQYTVEKNATGLTIVKYLGDETDVKIPQKIKGTLVTSIGDGAFYENKLTSVVIPNGVTSIEKNAFCYNCLTSVVIPDSVTSIGSYAFYYNNLTSVVIPEGVTSIENYVFASNKLTSVVIPDSVTSIIYSAFRDNSLTSVKIPDGVTSIGNYAFSYNNLISVVIPKGITSIDSYAFCDNNLTSVVIPGDAPSIKYNAFSINKKISSITYLGKKLKVKCIDGDTMIIDSEKKIKDYKIYKCIYFGGDFRECFVAKKGDFFAHGDSIKQAIEEVNFKFLQENFDLKILVSKIKEKNTVSVHEYRLLTGACSLGCDIFRKENEIKEIEIPLEKVLEITKGNYGNEKMLELFN